MCRRWVIILCLILISCSPASVVKEYHYDPGFYKLDLGEILVLPVKDYTDREYRFASLVEDPAAEISREIPDMKFRNVPLAYLSRTDQQEFGRILDAWELQESPAELLQFLRPRTRARFLLLIQLYRYSESRTSFINQPTRSDVSQRTTVTDSHRIRAAGIFRILRLSDGVEVFKMDYSRDESSSRTKSANESFGPTLRGSSPEKEAAEMVRTLRYRIENAVERSATQEAVPQSQGKL
ncbi:MAG: hypothetical protein CMF59_05140 [Leptospiraceae bacterium]|nr:hypothetical protein [Leptospiraceae bacterium]